MPIKAVIRGVKVVLGSEIVGPVEIVVFVVFTVVLVVVLIVVARTQVHVL